MKRLLELRKMLGVTQEKVAKYLGVARNTYTRYETGEREPDFKTLQKLADYFNVTTDYLLERTDDTHPQKLIIPDELKGAKVAYHHGEFEDLTQYEMDKLAEFAMFLKTQRNTDTDKNDVD